MRVELITNPNKSAYQNLSLLYKDKYNESPEVSTSLKPINREDANLEAEKEEH